MPDRSSGFIAAHAARGNRNILKIGLVLTLLGAGLSWLFGNPFGLLFVSLPGAVALAFWLRRRIYPETHAAYTQLARFGDADGLADEVDRAFAGVPVDEAAHLGAAWLAQGDTYGVHLVPWREVAWLHLLIRSRNGVRSKFIRVWTRDGRTFVVPVRLAQGEDEAILDALYARAPWAEVGYSPERQAEWQKHRADVIARVDARRAAMPPA